MLLAADADAAVGRAGCLEGPLHLILSDVVMPKASGREAGDRLIRLCPRAKVLHMSGYADDALLHHGVLGGEVPLLEKPFSPNTLASRVREVLDGGAASGAPRGPSRGSAFTPDK